MTDHVGFFEQQVFLSFGSYCPNSLHLSFDRSIQYDQVSRCSRNHLYPQILEYL